MSNNNCIIIDVINVLLMPAATVIYIESIPQLLTLNLSRYRTHAFFSCFLNKIFIANQQT